MANLEKIMAETSKSYDASRKALNNQINAISGDLVAQQDRINAQYAQQGQDLNNQRNWQAQATSMAASRNGGSFGGASQIANDRYYQQAFVPALTKMYTNRSNDLSSAETQANQHRQQLETTLAGLNDEARRYAYQRYDAAKEAEREDKYRQQQLALQRKQLAAQQAASNWSQYLDTPKYGINQNASKDGQIWYQNNNTGASVRFGTYAKSMGGNYKGLLQTAASYGDNDSIRVMNYLAKHPNAKISYMGGGGTQAYSGNSALTQSLNRLGIKISGVK